VKHEREEAVSSALLDGTLLSARQAEKGRRIMQFIGYHDDSRVMVGVRIGEDRVAPVAEISDFYRDLEHWTQKARHMKSGDLTLADLSLAPAVQPSARILCVGLNYRTHAAEGGFSEPDIPVIFGRWTASLAVDGTPIPVPIDEPGLDWEIELAVVVGKRMQYVDERTAREGVFGYATFNDVSARRAQKLTAQWTLGKNADQSGPIGQIVTADEVGDPGNGLRLVTRVNGQIMQDGNTRNMIFSVGHLLAHLSRTMTLHPGDVVATGTPDGVGYARQPPQLLQPGDVVEVEVERLGRVRNPIIAVTDASDYQVKG
jgi:2,4-diketo-3-deoxy-L-fuconate hydrolase